MNDDKQKDVLLSSGGLRNFSSEIYSAFSEFALKGQEIEENSHNILCPWPGTEFWVSAYPIKIQSGRFRQLNSG